MKRVRKSVENELDLKEDFFKTDDTWTSKSKLVIQAEVVRAGPIEAIGLGLWLMYATLGHTSREWRNIVSADLKSAS